MAAGSTRRLPLVVSDASSRGIDASPWQRSSSSNSNCDCVWSVRRLSMTLRGLGSAPSRVESTRNQQRPVGLGRPVDHSSSSVVNLINWILILSTRPVARSAGVDRPAKRQRYINAREISTQHTHTQHTHSLLSATEEQKPAETEQWVLKTLNCLAEADLSLSLSLCPDPTRSITLLGY